MKTKFNFVIFITFLVVTLIFGATALAGYVSDTTNVKIVGTYNYDLAKEVLSIVNEERAKAGLSALSFDSSLQKTANERAAESAIYFSHDRPSKNTTQNNSCFELYPINRGGYYAENIAIGNSTAKSVMKSWMNSSGHKANIMDAKYKYIGISCFITNGNYVWVQSFQSVGNKSETTTNGIVKKDISVLSNRVKLLASDLKLKTGDIKDITVLGQNAGFQNFKYEIDISTASIKSSDTNVIQINAQNQLVAKSAGSSTITISASGKSAKFKVTVNDQIQGLKLNKTDLTLTLNERGFATETLTATIYPSTAESAKIKWQIQDCSPNAIILVTKDSGKINAYTPGTATVVASLGNGMSTSCKLTVKDYQKPISNTVANTVTNTINKTPNTNSINNTVSTNSVINQNPQNTNTMANKVSSTNTVTNQTSTTNTVVTNTTTNSNTNNVTNTTTNTNTTNQTTNTVPSEPVNNNNPTSLVVQNPNKTINIHVGESHNIVAYAFPAEAQKNADLTFSASDTNIASVNKIDGARAEVVGKTAGTMTVTVKTANGLTDTCTINVTDDFVPGGVGIIGDLQKTLKIGDTYSIYAIPVSNISTDQTVKYESDNPSVATVDSNGNVIAQSSGTCTIFAYLYSNREQTGRSGQNLQITVEAD